MKHRFLFLLLLLTALLSCTGPHQQVMKTSMAYGHRLFSLGLYDEALFHYRRILESEHLSPQEKSRVLNNLAVIYEMMDDYLKARETYREALETDSDGDIYENYKRFMGGL